MFYRNLLVSLLAAACVSADAEPLTVLRAPVNVAFGLYKGCIVGTLQSSRPEKRNEIPKFVEELDNYCLEWTVIWYSTQPVPIASWTPDTQKRFNDRRVSLMGELVHGLLETTPR